MGDNRRIRHLRRGSALVYSSMLMVAITTVVVTTSLLNAAASGKAERQIDLVMSEESESGALAYVSAMCNEQTISLPATYNLSLNGQTQTVSVVNADATMSRSIRVNTLVNGKFSRSFERLLAGRQANSPMYYALFLGRASDLSSTLLTTSNGGHVFCRQSLTLGATSTIDGEVAAVDTVTDNGATVTKNIVSGARDRTLPTVNNADYQLAAAGLINLVSSISNLTFLGTGLGLPYPLKYYRGNTMLKGMINGKGTVYIEGSVTVNGAVKYSDANSRALIIVEGNLTVTDQCDELDGIWIVRGNISVASAVAPLVNSRGSIAAFNRLECFRPLTITADKSFWIDRNEAVRHRAPGFWPTAITGLLR